jgi:hypothetical protein
MPALVAYLVEFHFPGNNDNKSKIELVVEKNVDSWFRKYQRISKKGGPTGSSGGTAADSGEQAFADWNTHNNALIIVKLSDKSIEAGVDALMILTSPTEKLMRPALVAYLVEFQFPGNNDKSKIELVEKNVDSWFRKYQGLRAKKGGPAGSSGLQALTVWDTHNDAYHQTRHQQAVKKTGNVNIQSCILPMVKDYAVHHHPFSIKTLAKDCGLTFVEVSDWFSTYNKAILKNGKESVSSDVVEALATWTQLGERSCHNTINNMMCSII